MEFIAHIAESNSGEKRIQTVKEHLEAVAQMAGAFASAFDASGHAARLGISHDAGKYAGLFQQRIRGASLQVDHATAGAKILLEQGDLWGAMAVAGHHGGLPDYGSRIDTAEENTLCGRVLRKLPDYSPFFEEIALPPLHVPDCVTQRDGFAQSFYIRMLYSCLVDADYLDTERFMQADTPPPRGGYASIAALKARFDRYAAAHWSKTDTALNRTRYALRMQCEQAAEQPPGLYSLTVPTGGGKTAASMAFALRHAEKHGKRRIIYVIPYTSIIEQNSDVFSEALGGENVLQHHSNMDFPPREQETTAELRRRLSAENWDAPVIMTTAVQFFESLFAAKPSRCRKLHNLANSVVIFDEAQMLPVQYLRPCAAAISELAAHYGVTAVLCTATQPALDWLFAEFDQTVTEICPQIDHEIFRRVQYVYDRTLPFDGLCARLQAEPQVLCIVNTRKAAKQLFLQLADGGSFHLSTCMTPNSRRRTLQTIRERLRAGLPCRLIATSLVEAGVDVDFPTVYRELAGIDSIVQAAGRCNREGRQSPEESLVHIFRSENTPPKQIAVNIGAAENILERVGLPDHPSAVTRYFRRLYRNTGDEGLDEKQILKALNEGVSGCRLPLRTVAGQFRLIEEDTCTVYIPTEGNAPLLVALRSGQHSRTLFRRLAQDAVSVYPYQYRQLMDSGCLEPVEVDAAILCRPEAYNEATGLQVEPAGGCALFC